LAKIKKISLTDFRNFSNLKITFKKKSNIFFGKNGSGKTNLLEAISLISKGRGLRNSQFKNLINKNKKKFKIESSLEIKKNDYDIKIYTDYSDTKYKKIILVNEDNSKENLDFLYSSISFLFFLPEMERLFQSSPTTRRNFIDRLIFSRESKYNKLINKYKKNILERNKILQENLFDDSWLSAIENEISNIGLQIYELRNTQVQDLNKFINILNLSNNYPFKISLKIIDDFYNPNMTIETYLTNLLDSRQFDKKFGGTKIGPHKSDIIAKIDNEYDASLLSTGQQKTVVLMILLAQCKFLVEIKKIEPVVLLDEICSHLDSENRKILLDMINHFDIQFFLTGTEKTLFSFISTNVQFYNITDQ